MNFFGKIMKIEFGMKLYKLFFQKDALIASKTRLSISFIKQIQIVEWE